MFWPTKAYSSAANRAYLRRRHIPATIPIKADQQANRKAKGSAGDLHCRHHRVETGSHRLDRPRAVGLGLAK